MSSNHVSVDPPFRTQLVDPPWDTVQQKVSELPARQWVAWTLGGPKFGTHIEVIASGLTACPSFVIFSCGKSLWIKKTAMT